MGATKRAHDLFGYRLGARDGSAGHVHDLYFDDRRWLVRYLVVDVRHGLASRRVLISPSACVAWTPTPGASTSRSAATRSVSAPTWTATGPSRASTRSPCTRTTASPSTGHTATTPRRAAAPIRTCAACAP